MQDSGQLSGVSISADYFFSKSYQLSLSVSFLDGDTQYDGALQWTDGTEVKTKPFSSSSVNSITKYEVTSRHYLFNNSVSGLNLYE